MGKNKKGLDNIPIVVEVRDFDKTIFKSKGKDAKKAMKDLNNFVEEKGLI